MICPHCRVAFNEKQEIKEYSLDSDSAASWYLVRLKCPSCEKFILILEKIVNDIIMWRYLFYPKGTSRPPCPQEVPSEIAEDYNESCLVLVDSAKASAALSRRCLQNLLRSKTPIKHGDLANEIQQVLDTNILPIYLADGIDAVRNHGNFAAHPIKSQHTGEIMDVEPGEAEWNLEILEGLFDFFYVQPEILRKKKEALNKKLDEAGKPPMK